MSYACDTCGKNFSRHFNLQRHKKSFHCDTSQIAAVPCNRAKTHVPFIANVSNSNQSSPKMYLIQLKHPFGLMVSGGTKTGKTTFVKQLLANASVMIDQLTENIIYFYSEYQDTFPEIEVLVPGIQFVQG